jgi:hypothetical protein
MSVKIPGILYLLITSLVIVMIGTGLLVFIQPFIPFGALGLLGVGIILALVLGITVRRSKCR